MIPVPRTVVGAMPLHGTSFATGLEPGLYVVESASACRSTRVLDTRGYTRVINNFRKSRDWKAAVGVLSEMWQILQAPNAITYGCVISACERAQQWQSALLLLAEMSNMQVQPDAIGYTAAMTACGKSRHWQHAVGLLTKMQNERLQMDIAAYGAAVQACENSDEWQMCLQLLSEMHRGTHARNSITHGSAIGACSRSGPWELALVLMDEMREGSLEFNVHACSSAVVACDKGQLWEYALMLIGEMRSSRIQRSAVELTPAICACRSARKWPAVLEILRGMQSESVNFDVGVFNAAISVCSASHQWCPAVDLLNAMQQDTITPNIATYTAVIMTLGESRQWAQAVSLLVEMWKHRVPRNMFMYRAALQACTEPEQCEHVLQQLLDVDATDRCNKLLGAVQMLESDNVLEQHVRSVAGKALEQWASEMDRTSVASGGFRVGADPCDADGVDVPYVLSERKHVVVLWKPPGWTTIVGNGDDSVNEEDDVLQSSKPVQSLLQSRFGEQHPIAFDKGVDYGLAHRLDRDTSGILIWAKTYRGYFASRLGFGTRQVSKVYLCLCHGELRIDQRGRWIEMPLRQERVDGRWRSVPDTEGKPASTELLSVAPYASNDGEPFTLVELAIHTGRMHQIRAHLSFLGHPLVGDEFYGGGLRRWCRRTFLHAGKLAMDAGDGPFQVTCPLPEDLRAALELLNPVDSVAASWMMAPTATVEELRASRQAHLLWSCPSATLSPDQAMSIHHPNQDVSS